MWKGNRFVPTVLNVLMPERKGLKVALFQAGAPGRIDGRCWVYGWTMDCAECERLTIEYESSERAFEAAISDLSSNRESVHLVEYQRLRKVVDDARPDAKVASLALVMHRQVHKIDSA